MGGGSTVCNATFPSSPCTWCTLCLWASHTWSTKTLRGLGDVGQSHGGNHFGSKTVHKSMYDTSSKSHTFPPDGLGWMPSTSSSDPSPASSRRSHGPYSVCAPAGRDVLVLLGTASKSSESSDKSMGTVVFLNSFVRVVSCGVQTQSFGLVEVGGSSPAEESPVAFPTPEIPGFWRPTGGVVMYRPVRAFPLRRLGGGGMSNAPAGGLVCLFPVNGILSVCGVFGRQFRVATV
jgi:hypothetical protein